MTSYCKQEENSLRKIISDNVSPKNNQKINLHIYYKNKKLSQLFIKNNIHGDDVISHVVYQYSCTNEECLPSNNYIGYTITSLNKRFSMHAQTGSILNHAKSAHNLRPCTKEMLKNVKVLYKSVSKEELLIAESLYIKTDRPRLNNQREGETRILKFF